MKFTADDDSVLLPAVELNWTTGRKKLERRPGRVCGNLEGWLRLFQPGSDAFGV